MIAENVFWLFCCFCHYYRYFLVMLSQYYGEISAIFIEALWKQIPSVSNFFGVPCGELIFIKEPWAPGLLLAGLSLKVAILPKKNKHNNTEKEREGIYLGSFLGE